MRGNKFRAWDKTSKRMSQPKTISDIAIMKDGVVDLAILSNTLEWLEWTGLKDKNGVEIYDGDIAQLCDIDNAQRVVVVFNHHQAAFMFREISHHKDTEDFMHASYFSELHPDRVSREVIGNIYENPELVGDE